MKPSNPIYLGSPPDPGDQSPLTKCHKCQRLNTLNDYRRNDGECPKCGTPNKRQGVLE